MTREELDSAIAEPDASPDWRLQRIRRGSNWELSWSCLARFREMWRESGRCPRFCFLLLLLHFLFRRRLGKA